MNEVGNVPRFLEKNRKDGTDSLFFVINVWKSDGQTFISGNENPGCQFAICSYESKSNKCVYGDSLGWEITGGLSDKIKLYAEACFNSHT